MTAPNLDALAKLGPFVTLYSSAQDAVVIEGAGCEHVDWSDAEAALNEWVELRATVAELRAALKLETHKVITCGVAATNPDAALTLRDDYMRWNSPQAERVRALRAERDELRAYRERTEKALADVCECADDDAFESLEARLTKHGRGLWRDPAPKEASDGR